MERGIASFPMAKIGARELNVSAFPVNCLMQDFGKLLFIGGVVVALLGAWLWSGRGLGWFGRLPGDISYQSGDVRFSFPVTTSVLLSVVLSLLAWFFRR
jgi:hypothetical protein